MTKPIHLETYIYSSHNDYQGNEEQEMKAIDKTLRNKVRHQQRIHRINNDLFEHIFKARNNGYLKIWFRKRTNEDYIIKGNVLHYIYLNP